MPQFDSLIDLAKNIITVLALLGVVIDVTPVIKINPYRLIFAKLRDALLGPIIKRLDAIEQWQYDKDVRDMRGEILAFSKSCHDKELHTNAEFVHIIEQIGRYQDTIAAHGLKNGVIDADEQYIKDLYRELLREGSLL